MLVESEASVAMILTFSRSNATLQGVDSTKLYRRLVFLYGQGSIGCYRGCLLLPLTVSRTFVVVVVVKSLLLMLGFESKNFDCPVFAFVWLVGAPTGLLDGRRDVETSPRYHCECSEGWRYSIDSNKALPHSRKVGKRKCKEQTMGGLLENRIPS